MEGEEFDFWNIDIPKKRAGIFAVILLILNGLILFLLIKTGLKIYSEMYGHAGIAFILYGIPCYEIALLMTTWTMVSEFLTSKEKKWKTSILFDEKLIKKLEKTSEIEIFAKIAVVPCGIIILILEIKTMF